MSNRLTFGSLFSGIGGLDLGLERAGMQCKWQVEIDDYATRVLERHWPNVRRWRDVWDFIGDANGKDDTAVEAGNQKKRDSSTNSGGYSVDLICGGFPCQPVSVAGARRGDRDDRWLWPAFRRVLGILTPRYVLAENVPGLLSADAGRLFGNVLGDLATLGYDAEWQVLPAAAFGAPHLRERVFIVAYAIRSECESGTGRWGIRQGNSAAAHTTGDGSGEESAGAQRQHRHTDSSGQVDTTWRSVKPTIRRGDDGPSAFLDRVARLRCLGNAVVPQVAEWIGRQIIAMAGGER